MQGVTSSNIVLKEIYVISTNATNTLSIAITVPPGLTNTMTPREADRIWGQQLAATDHQARVQKPDASPAICVPAFGKTGEQPLSDRLRHLPRGQTPRPDGPRSCTR